MAVNIVGNASSNKREIKLLKLVILPKNKEILSKLISNATIKEIPNNFSYLGLFSVSDISNAIFFCSDIKFQHFSNLIEFLSK